MGTEHPLLGILAQRDARGVSALMDFGVTLDTGRAALIHTVGRAGLGASDADALRTLGIDLDDVRQRVEAAFEPGALDHPPRTALGHGFAGRGPDASLPTTPVTSRSCRGPSVRSNALDAKLSISATAPTASAVPDVQRLRLSP